VEITQHRGLSIDIANVAAGLNVGSGWSSWRAINQDREKSDTIFSKDLLLFLTSVSMAKIKSNPEGMIEIDKGDWVIPFDFTIPEDVPESYKGKNVTISYGVTAMGDRAWLQNVKDTVSFNVPFNPKRRYENVDKKEIKQTNRLDIKLVLEDGGRRSNGRDANNTYSPGDSIRGKIIIPFRNDDSKKRVRNVEVILSAIEFLNLYVNEVWTERREVIEEYKQTINLKQEHDSNNNNNIAFEIQIPDNAKRNYVAKYSEYYWLLEAKLNIPNAHHVTVSTVIEVL
jgi:hypothetical protein